MLYGNEQVSKTLRERFVLHWESERPVPRVTIDFGDGRRLERTVTGNAVHYVLTPDGRPVDAIPGLYGPEAFLAALDRAGGIAGRLACVPDGEREDVLLAHHASRLEALDMQWKADLARARSDPALGTTGREAPPARKAVLLARGKSAMEMPILDRAAGVADGGRPEWPLIAALHASEARLDPSSIAMMRRHQPNALKAMRLAMSKTRIEDPMLHLVAGFERSLAEDTVRNEYTLHRRIHEWFAEGEAGPDLHSLNERVYAEIFLTPASDPWLGLAPAEAYAALENGGMAR